MEETKNETTNQQARQTYIQSEYSNKEQRESELKIIVRVHHYHGFTTEFRWSEINLQRFD